MDAGKLTQKELHLLLILDMPGFAQEISTFLSGWMDTLYPIPDRIDFLYRAHHAGFPLYLLSDFPKEASRYFHKKYDFFSLFDGILLSSDCGITKPDPDIFRLFIKKFSLNPPETLFFDDLLLNINVANSFEFATQHVVNNTNFFNAAKKHGVYL